MARAQYHYSTSMICASNVSQSSGKSAFRLHHQETCSVNKLCAAKLSVLLQPTQSFALEGFCVHACYTRGLLEHTGTIWHVHHMLSLGFSSVGGFLDVPKLAVTIALQQSTADWFL